MKYYRRKSEKSQALASKNSLFDEKKCAVGAYLTITNKCTNFSTSTPVISETFYAEKIAYFDAFLAHFSNFLFSTKNWILENRGVDD